VAVLSQFGDRNQGCSWHHTSTTWHWWVNFSNDAFSHMYVDMLHVTWSEQLSYCVSAAVTALSKSVNQNVCPGHCTNKIDTCDSHAQVKRAW